MTAANSKGPAGFSGAIGASRVNGEWSCPLLFCSSSSLRVHPLSAACACAGSLWQNASLSLPPPDYALWTHVVMTVRRGEPCLCLVSSLAASLTGPLNLRVVLLVLAQYSASRGQQALWINGTRVAVKVGC